MADGNESTAGIAIGTGSAPVRRKGVVRRAVLAQLGSIERGEIRLIENGVVQRLGRRTEEFPVRVTIEVLDDSAYRDVAVNGTIGAGESYMAGKWIVDDLTGLIRIFTANPETLAAMDSGLRRLFGWSIRLGHAFRRNSRGQSRRNIRAHYDLGNELFELFLDPTLSYSSAIYPRENSSLEEAARHKLDVVCSKLDLQPDDHLVEIGTGWGGLAIHAAANYGCRVTTTTISENQYLFARKRVAAAGLEDRVTVLKQDYRELSGEFDKLVSIEMIEAVGHRYLDVYLQTCSRLLRPHGRALIQAILMSDRNFEAYRRSVDFIQKYIFPGGALPSLGSIMQAVHTGTDLQICDFHDIGLDYARTLRDWRGRFIDRLPEVRALGYPEQFVRMWEFYLSYCEGGFLERAITTAQLVFDKPLCRIELTA